MRRTLLRIQYARLDLPLISELALVHLDDITYEEVVDEFDEWGIRPRLLQDEELCMRYLLQSCRNFDRVAAHMSRRVLYPGDMYMEILNRMGPRQISGVVRRLVTMPPPSLSYQDKIADVMNVLQKLPLFYLDPFIVNIVSWLEWDATDWRTGKGIGAANVLMRYKRRKIYEIIGHRVVEMAYATPHIELFTLLTWLLQKRCAWQQEAVDLITKRFRDTPEKNTLGVLLCTPVAAWKDDPVIRETIVDMIMTYEDASGEEHYDCIHQILYFIHVRPGWAHELCRGFETAIVDKLSIGNEWFMLDILEDATFLKVESCTIYRALSRISREGQARLWVMLKKWNL
jgi:hypothetical protein